MVIPTLSQTGGSRYETAAPLLLLHDHIGCSILRATAYGAILLAQRAYPRDFAVQLISSSSLQGNERIDSSDCQLEEKNQRI